MQVQEILRQADEILFEQTGEHLDDLQNAILESAVMERKYTEVASEHHRTEGHIRDVAYELWNALSKSLGEEVNKSNLRSVMERSCVFNIRNSVNSINSGRIDNLSLLAKDSIIETAKNQNSKLDIITVTPDLQVVIPKEACKHIGLKQGQKLQIARNGEKIELIPCAEKSDREVLWEKMRQLREQIVASGIPLLDDEALNQEIQEQHHQLTP
jgi:AbrB family looped-hinge helix DNA binding protein